MKHLGDITLIDGSKIEPVDVITFGSPCQDLSIAGKRAGLAGQRSGLFMEAVRIIKQMQEATNGEYPKYAVWENVPGAFSSNKGKDFLAVLEELIRIKEPAISLPEPPKSKWSKAGEVSGSGWSLAWRTMDAQYWGVPQRRLRISLVLDLTGQRAGEILFEPESLRGHFAPSITPGQATAGAVENGAGTADCTDAIPVNLQIATRHKSLGERTGLGIGQAGDAAYTLQEGHEHGVCCLEDAKAYTLKIRSGCEGGGKGALVQTEKSATLSTLQDQTLFVAEPTFCIQGNTINCYAATTEPNMVICNDCSPAIRSRDYKDPNIVCYDARGNGDGMLSPTITGDHNSRITDYTAVVIEKIIRWIVRRLTPTECERLQGYPDGWTDLGEWVDSKGKAHKAADAPRYKALGNSIALPQWYYVLGGIADRLPDNATLGSLFDGIGGFPYVWAQLHAGRKELCVWASEIEEFPIAVTKVHFPES
jgi:DNA (cytosine-5)-methyltransferase 1